MKWTTLSSQVVGQAEIFRAGSYWISLISNTPSLPILWHRANLFIPHLLLYSPGVDRYNLPSSSFFLLVKYSSMHSYRITLFNYLVVLLLGWCCWVYITSVVEGVCTPSYGEAFSQTSSFTFFFYKKNCENIRGKILLPITLLARPPLFGRGQYNDHVLLHPYMFATRF